jgi:hypothetical protein
MKVEGYLFENMTKEKAMAYYYVSQWHSYFTRVIAKGKESFILVGCEEEEMETLCELLGEEYKKMVTIENWTLVERVGF